MVKGNQADNRAGDMSWEERLRILCLSALEKRRSRGDLIAPCSCLGFGGEGGVGEAERDVELCSLVVSDRRERHKAAGEAAEKNHIMQPIHRFLR